MMLRRWIGGLSALIVLAAIAILIICDLDDAGFRHWWEERALTTSMVGGLLVLSVTVLVVDQVVSLRQEKDRSRVTGAQSAIVLAQGIRATDAVTAVLGGSGEKEAATEEIRTYLTMVLIVAPLLVETSAPRHFLELAQHLAGELAGAMVVIARSPGRATEMKARVDEAVANVREAAAPLTVTLTPDQQRAVSGSNGSTEGTGPG
jgi:hypothetical protein